MNDDYDDYMDSGSADNRRRKDEAWRGFFKAMGFIIAGCLALIGIHALGVALWELLP